MSKFTINFHRSLIFFYMSHNLGINTKRLGDINHLLSVLWARYTSMRCPILNTLYISCQSVPLCSWMVLNKGGTGNILFLITFRFWQNAKSWFGHHLNNESCHAPEDASHRATSWLLEHTSGLEKEPSCPHRAENPWRHQSISVCQNKPTLQVL